MILRAITSNNSLSSPPSSDSINNIEAGIDGYLDNASDDEINLFKISATNEDKVKSLVYLLENQINEEYAIKELATLRQYLTAEELNRLDNEKDPLKYQELLKSYFETYSIQTDLEELVDQLLLASSPKEFERVLQAKTVEELSDTFVDMVTSRDSGNESRSAVSLGRGLVFALPKATRLLRTGALLARAVTAIAPFAPIIATAAAVAGTASILDTKFIKPIKPIRQIKTNNYKYGRRLIIMRLREHKNVWHVV
ncbi:hypothetical protein [Streptococcus cuniculipharyngis]|uniref:Uncharacterized protein n=1 Tax=Streptococcus cuniculipharyngis TaxID=1562651 RepID=A0A5C5SCM9_9STRE|nr:hypothetical protein [Streptococcus cuniculipharyngis]TWS98716.1 hypothetical protein FRX57_00370 [Streptococcus cuniculipharyngis]